MDTINEILGNLQSLNEIDIDFNGNFVTLQRNSQATPKELEEVERNVSVMEEKNLMVYLNELKDCFNELCGCYESVDREPIGIYEKFDNAYNAIEEALKGKEVTLAHPISVLKDCFNELCGCYESVDREPIGIDEKFDNAYNAIVEALKGKEVTLVHPTHPISEIKDIVSDRKIGDVNRTVSSIKYAKQDGKKEPGEPSIEEE